MSKKEIPLIIPPKIEGIDRWVILGLDPSMSRTGYAMMEVYPTKSDIVDPSQDVPAVIHEFTNAHWLAAGSVKSDSIENGMHPRNTIWLRAKLMALYLRSLLDSRIWDSSIPDPNLPRTGLIISMEFPTPMNDYLVALNRILHLVFFERPMPHFVQVRIMYTNAATLRSLMKLTARGAKNKTENIARAYDFIERAKFPELDTDSCDAILLSMMARHAASIIMGCPTEIPQNFLNSLCNATQEVKGNGRNQRIVTKGLLHRVEYWYEYKRQNYDACVKDASNPKKSLARIKFNL